MRIVHVGNDPSGSGGIATVIRRHLGRDIGAHMDHVVSYRQDASTSTGRNWPFLPAVWTVVTTRPGGVIWHVHLSHRGSIVREGLILWAARLRGHRALVATLHGSSLTQASRLLVRSVFWVLAPACVIHVLSSAHRDLPGGGRRVVVPNDVAIPATVTPMTERLSQVFFAGEVSERKGVDLLLRAWESIRRGGWTLTLAGPVGGGFEIPAAASGVRWLGEIEYADVIVEMGRSPIVVLPSRAEALPMSVCEGMAHGCLVIATDVGGTVDLLGRSNSHLIPPDDVDALARALESAIQDPEARNAASVENRGRARALFGSATVDRAWTELYQECGARLDARDSA